MGHFLGQKKLLPDAVSADAVGVIVSAACLAHDIGNPPFGHAGEQAIARWFANASSNSVLVKADFLDEELSDLTNFEGNAQGFRVLSRLQANVDQGGLQLTCAVLAAFAKYPCGSSARSTTSYRGASVNKFGFFEADRKLFNAVADHTGLIEREPGIWMRHPLNFLVEAADDICFACVDLEDAFKLKYCSFAEVEERLRVMVDKIDDQRYCQLEDDQKIGYLRAKAIGQLVDQAARAFQERHEAILEGQFDEALLKYVANSAAVADAKRFTSKHVFESSQVSKTELAGFKVIEDLVDRFARAVIENCKLNTDCSPLTKRHLLILPPRQSDVRLYDKLLRVTDFVSGMTDNYALSLYRDLNGIGRDSLSSG